MCHHGNTWAQQPVQSGNWRTSKLVLWFQKTHYEVVVLKTGSALGFSISRLMSVFVVVEKPINTIWLLSIVWVKKGKKIKVSFWIKWFCSDRDRQTRPARAELLVTKHQGTMQCFLKLQTFSSGSFNLPSLSVDISCQESLLQRCIFNVFPNPSPSVWQEIKAIAHSSF